MKEKIVLIDGHSILNRAFYGIPELTNSQGIHTNAVYGFLKILFKILDEEKPQYLAVAFDMKAPTFRHKMYAAYKGTRKPMPEELHEQIPVMKQVLRAMNVFVIEQEGYEADDLLGTMARESEQQGLLVSVVSGDRDLLQLATEYTKIRIPKTKKGKTEIENYNTAEVIERYQVTPIEFIDVKALMGDTSDNIPGVPGIGEKTATKLIAQYKSLDSLYAHLGDMKNGKAKTSLEDNKKLAYLSRELAEICTECPISFSLQEAHMDDFFTQEAYELFTELEFKNMLYYFSNKKTESFNPEVKIISDFAEAEQIFAKAGKMQKLGLFINSEKNICSIGLSLSEKDNYFLSPQGFISSAYLLDNCMKLLAECPCVCVCDVQKLFEVLPDAADYRLIGHVFDSSLAAYLINPLQSSYSYDMLAKQYCDIFVKDKQELLGKGHICDIIESDSTAAADYAALHSYTALRSYNVLSEKLAGMKMTDLLAQIEMPLAVTLFHMQQNGILVHREELEQYSTMLGTRLDELSSKIFEQAGEEFNINSPKQLGEILFEKLALPNGKKTKTGFSTSAEVLDKLKNEHEIIPNLLEYRQLTKLKSTYADGLVPFIQEDGKIHSTFNQKVTATGRISSTEPNLQNIPVRMELGRLIRKVFYPKEGSVFVDADYSQIELRVLAHMSGDERLKDAFTSGKDIHAATASEVFHTPIEEVTSLQRRNAKAVNFGIVYGISAFGLSQDLDISRKEASEYIEKYFATYPKIKQFLDYLVADAKKDGFVSSIFGRRRPVPEISSSNFMTRSFGERIAMNSPIQGTAADIIKIAMIRVDKRLLEEGHKARLLLQVHDELLIEAPADELDRVKEILEDEMKKAAALDVTLEVDMNVGSNWYEAK